MTRMKCAREMASRLVWGKHEAHRGEVLGVSSVHII